MLSGVGTVVGRLDNVVQCLARPKSSENVGHDFFYFFLAIFDPSDFHPTFFSLQAAGQRRNGEESLS